MAIESKQESINPANKVEKLVKPEGYMPMSMGNALLEVPERAGYARRWFRGEPGRIARAQKAGWSFVKDDDVTLNNRDLGGDANVSGNTDMGTHVSVVSGTDDANQVLRMYLMEIPLEWYEESRQILADRNESIAEALRSGNIDGQRGEDLAARNLNKRKEENASLFTKKHKTSETP